MSKYNPYLETARALAMVSGEALRRYFRTGLTAERKSDDSPVTNADRTAEQAMRDFLAKHHPDHGILGEEGGTSKLDAEYVWVLDPLDGTLAFMAGKPTFSTLIGLLHHGKPVMGLLHQPITRELWIGVEGKKTTLSGNEVKPRACASFKDAVLSTTSPFLFNAQEKPHFDRLSEACARTAYGADGYAYAAMVSGGCDLVCEAGLKPYDFCALIPIIQGAGGVISDWQGQPLDPFNEHAQVLAAGDIRLHQQALERLSA